MDNNVYKLHLFEVYSSDEEEIEDINELQEESNLKGKKLSNVWS